MTKHPWDPGVDREAQTISYQLQWGWIPAVLSDPVHVVSGVSAHAETLHHRRPVLTQELWEDLPPGSEGLGIQLCLTLCNTMNCSPPASSIHGILQARILERVAIPFSRGSSWSRDQTQVSCIAGRFFTIWATRESPSNAWDYPCMRFSNAWETVQRLDIEFKFPLSRTETKDYRGSANSTHLSETSSHLPSLGALPPHSPERQEEPEAPVPLQHHHSPHQGHRSSDLGLLSTEQGSDETTLSGLVSEIPKIPSDPAFLSC